MGTETSARIPRHLRQYIVQQEYSAYDEIDQAVWRFTLLQTYNGLKDIAHPAYVDGLMETGIGIDRIPSVQEMDTCLSRYGWGAVCVDGFIPPRAFQEFQALKIMTIAADIRTPAHVAYTPAPDIIHESAGHSPIVPNLEYRDYLQRFGEIGQYAFSSQEDEAVYLAIRNVSIIKESPTSSLKDIKTAENLLHDAINSVTWVSETASLSRLHWWTVEYGLIGTPDDFRIYGAGLLSSVGESYFCQNPEVEKIPLSVDCILKSYDITKPQPQLYVVENFNKLNDILDEVASTLSFKRGGEEALDMAVRSGEVATVELSSGVQVTGILTKRYLDADRSVYLQFKGPCCLAVNDEILKGHDRKAHLEGFGCPVGILENGTELSRLKERDLFHLPGVGLNKRVQLNYKSGVKVNGILSHTSVSDGGYLKVLSFKDCTVVFRDQILFQPDWGMYDLAIGDAVRTAYAGSADSSYWPASDFQDKSVPGKKIYNQKSRVLLQQYQKAISILESGTTEQVLDCFDQVHDTLRKSYPDHWLLRWNLLESLGKMDLPSRHSERLNARCVQLSGILTAELLEIENRFYNEAPISMGLRHLGVI